MALVLLYHYVSCDDCYLVCSQLFLYTSTGLLSGSDLYDIFIYLVDSSGLWARGACYWSDLAICQYPRFYTLRRTGVVPRLARSSQDLGTHGLTSWVSTSPPSPRELPLQEVWIASTYIFTACFRQRICHGNRYYLGIFIQCIISLR